MPMTTTSVSLSRVAMAVAASARRRLREHRVVVRRLVIRLECDADTLLAFRHNRADTGIADQVPADEVRVAAVEGVAERALNRVCAHEVEEARRTRGQAGGLPGFDLRQHRVLIGGTEPGKRRAA